MLNKTKNIITIQKNNLFQFSSQNNNYDINLININYKLPIRIFNKNIFHSILMEINFNIILLFYLKME